MHGNQLKEDDGEQKHDGRKFSRKIQSTTVNVLSETH